MFFKILNYMVLKVSKILKIGSLSVNGRNMFGRICVHHRGCGFSYKYRIIDYHRRLNQYGAVYRIVYDPNRTAFLGFVLYENGLFSYIIVSDKVVEGSSIFSGDSEHLFKKSDFNLFLGSSVPLTKLNLFQIVNNVELRPFFGSILARAAGVGLIIVNILDDKVTLKSKSGWLLTVSSNCMASLGFVSNLLHSSKRIKKAGIVRGWGWRPVVRGVAMNPCDHPHGGGEGKKGSPRNPKTPWGKLTRHTPTKNKKINRLNRRLFKKIR